MCRSASPPYPHPTHALPTHPVTQKYWWNSIQINNGRIGASLTACTRNSRSGTNTIHTVYTQNKLPPTTYHAVHVVLLHKPLVVFRACDDKNHWRNLFKAMNPFPPLWSLPSHVKHSKHNLRSRSTHRPKTISPTFLQEDHVQCNTKPTGASPRQQIWCRSL